MYNIVAISTAVSNSGVSIIKISGESSIQEVNKIFKGSDLTQVKNNTINYGKILEDSIEIDEVLVSIMRGPKSFTGEDVVEINCHGGILITQRIIQLLLTLDIEMAMPGDFSKRAFLNGKKSMVDLQKKLDLINAKNDLSLQMAIKPNDQKNNLIENLRSEILKIITLISVNIDYPEYEDLEEMTTNKVETKIDNLLKQINVIIENTQKGEKIKNGIKTAIIGKPNVGKSSILNYLSQNDKAIVTNIAGTTRDIVSSEINLKGITLQLMDTAGIRDTNNLVEQIGVQKSIELIESAELILFVVDGSIDLTIEEKKLYQSIINKNHLVIINKIDLDIQTELNLFEDYILISVLNNQGFNYLENKIMENLDLLDFDVQINTFLNTTHELNQFINVKNILNEIKSSLIIGIEVDNLEIDLKECLFILGRLIGLEVEENLLDEMFSKFCLGK